MRTFQTSRSLPFYSDLQQHHIIPLAVFCSFELRWKFVLLEDFGFQPRDFSSNGLLLPSTEAAAQRLKMPMHRGPHRYYNDLVFECVNLIFAPFDFDKITHQEKQHVADEIAKLQATLKAMLRQNRCNLRLNRNCPNNRDCINSHLDMAASILVSMIEDESKLCRLQI